MYTLENVYVGKCIRWRMYTLENVYVELYIPKTKITSFSAMTGFINTQIEEIVMSSILSIYTKANYEEKARITADLINSIEHTYKLKLTLLEKKHLRNKLHYLSTHHDYPTSDDSSFAKDEIISILNLRITKLEQEIKRLNETRLKIDPDKFVLAVLSEGMAFEQAARFMDKIDVGYPSKSAFMRKQKQFTSIIGDIVEKNLQFIQESLPQNLVVSFDGTWDHPRFATRCFGALIELTKGKIIDFFLILRTNSPIDHNFHVSTTQRYPQGLETEVLRKLAPIWFSDNKISFFIQDSHNKNPSIFREYNNNMYRKIAINHQYKRLTNMIKKFISTNKFSKDIQQSLLNFSRYILFLDASDVKKQELWSNVVNHFAGDHTKCIHSFNQSFPQLNEQQISLLRQFITLTFDEIICTTRLMHTQYNESLNHVRNFFAPKNLSFKHSYVARIYLLVLYWNMGPIYYKEVYEKIVGQTISLQHITNLYKRQRKWEKLKQKRNNSTYRKMSNDQRIKRKNTLRKTHTEGHISSTQETEQTQEQQPPANYPNDESTTNEQVKKSTINKPYFYLTEECEEEYDDYDWFAEDSSTEESAGFDITAADFIDDDCFDKHEGLIIEYLYPTHIIKGIRNPAKLCYAISILQLLTTNNYLIAEIIKNKDEPIRPLSDTFRKYTDDEVHIVEFPQSFIQYIMQFTGSIEIESDADEFLLAVFSSLEQSSSINHILLEQYLVISFSKNTCQNCRHEHLKDDQQFVMYLNIIGDDAIEIGKLLELNRCSTIERKCDNCLSQTYHEYEITFFPLLYLILVIKRYDINGNKNRTPIMINKHLAINDEDFELTGIIEHHGDTGLQGHYIFYVQRKEWMLCNDSLITPNNPPEISEHCYIIQYKKVIWQK